MTSDIGSTQPPTQPAAAPPARTNSFARIGGALFSPNETFRDIAARPDVVVPLAILLIVGFVCTLLISSHVDFESATRAALEQRSGEMSAEDMDRAVRIAGAFTKAIMYFAPAISAIIFLILAGVLLLAFRMFGGEGTFKQAFSVTLYSWFPQLIKGILMAIIASTRTAIPAERMNDIVMSNPGFLAHPTKQMVLYSLLSSLDVFTIWTMVLFIIGFAFVSRMSKAKSAAIVVGLWVVTLVFKLGFAALGASRMKQA